MTLAHYEDEFMKFKSIKLLYDLKINFGNNSTDVI